MSSLTTLGTRRIYEGKILSLRIDTIKNGDAPPVEREIVEHPGSVVIVPVTQRGTVLLVRQWRQPTGESLLEAPAGTLDSDDESPEDTAQRELREEIGHRAGRIVQLGAFWVAPGWCDEYMHAYLALDLTKDSLPGDVDEDIVVDEHPLARIPDLIRSGEIRDAKSIAALLMALSLYGAQLPEFAHGGR